MPRSIQSVVTLGVRGSHNADTTTMQPDMRSGACRLSLNTKPVRHHTKRHCRRMPQHAYRSAGDSEVSEAVGYPLVTVTGDMQPQTQRHRRDADGWRQMSALLVGAGTSSLLHGTRETPHEKLEIIWGTFFWSSIRRSGK